MEKLCRVDGCPHLAKTRGWCANHYMQFWTRGFRTCESTGCSLPPGPDGFCAEHRPVSDEKRCPRCATIKPLASFGRDSRTRDGYRCWCKPCNADAERVACPECGQPKMRRALRCGACSWTRKGPESARWTGGRTHNGEGYVLCHSPGHPGATTKGYVKEHRLVMESKLGRYLLPDESVHHINGVKDDNRPENLELWVTKQPKGQRPEDLVLWAREILQRYDPMFIGTAT